MRKIKQTQKDLSRKKKTVEKLLEELLEVHMKEHDRPRTINLADQILALKPTDAYPMEKVTSIFVDLNEADRAEAASNSSSSMAAPEAVERFTECQKIYMPGSRFGNSTWNM